MANIPKKLYQGSPSQEMAPLYEVINGKTILKNILLCNTESTTKKIDVYIQDGSDDSKVNNIIASYPVQGNDTIVIDMSCIMELGDSILSKQETTGAISLHVSGVEVL